MTKNEVLTLTASMRPHLIGDDLKKRFLDELEGRVAVEICRESVPVAPRADDAPLRVPAPFDRLYWIYLVSMMDFVSGDNASYAASHALFNEAYGAFARWHQRTGGYL